MLYVSPMKGKDLEKQVYDPLCCDHKVHSNSEMDSFKRYTCAHIVECRVVFFTDFRFCEFCLFLVHSFANSFCLALNRQ